MKYNIYESVKKAYIHPNLVKDIEFDEFVKELQESQSLLAKKEEGLLFNLCGWRDDFESPDYKPGHIRRCAANVIHLYALLLDIDSVWQPEDFRQQYADYEYLMYSTWSNSLEVSKFRVVMPLNTSITRSEFDLRHRALCDEFKIVDRSSFTISQAFYFPSYNKDNEHLAFIYHNKSPKRFPALLLPIQQSQVRYEPSVWTDRELQHNFQEAEQLLAELKQQRPQLSWFDWRKCAWGIAYHTTQQQAAQLLKQYYPEQHRNEYETLFHGWRRERSPRLGSVKMLLKNKADL